MRAEQITTYPPGIPAIVPGERITRELLGCLHTGLAAGMVLPDPAEPSRDTIRVSITQHTGSFRLAGSSASPDDPI